MTKTVGLLEPHRSPTLKQNPTSSCKMPQRLPRTRSPMLQNEQSPSCNILQVLPFQNGLILEHNPNSSGNLPQLLPSLRSRSSQVFPISSDQLTKVEDTSKTQPNPKGPEIQNEAGPSSQLVHVVPHPDGKVVYVGSKSYFIRGGHFESREDMQ